jgi:hypothetical protein
MMNRQNFTHSVQFFLQNRLQYQLSFLRQSTLNKYIASYPSLQKQDATSDVFKLIC